MYFGVRVKCLQLLGCVGSDDPSAAPKQDGGCAVAHNGVFIQMSYVTQRLRGQVNRSTQQQRINAPLAIGFQSVQNTNSYVRLEPRGITVTLQAQWGPEICNENNGTETKTKTTQIINIEKSNATRQLTEYRSPSVTK